MLSKKLSAASMDHTKPCLPRVEAEWGRAAGGGWRESERSGDGSEKREGKMRGGDRQKSAVGMPGGSSSSSSSSSRRVEPQGSVQ